MAGNIVLAWIFTLPGAAALAALATVADDVLGAGAGGALLIGAAAGALVLWVLSRRVPVTPENVNA